MSGFVEAVKFAVKGKEDNDKCFISITNPNRFCLKKTPDKVDGKLDNIIECRNFEQGKFDSGEYMDQDKFITSLLVHFERDESLEYLLDLVSNVSRASEVKSVDNGASQQVTVQDGIRLIAEKVENPIVLRPRRTFYEIDQPEAKYVIRFKKSERSGITISLHLIDDGKWQYEAINSIKEFLAEKKLGIKILA